MKTENLKLNSQKSSHWSTLAAFSVGMLAASPIWAADYPIPDSPLQTGARAPANLMLVLDDSGSMTDHTMPETLPVSLVTDIVNRTYTLNTIYYNPAITYLPWRKAVAGNIIRLANTPITAVYTDDVALTGNCNLLTNVGCVNINEVRDSNILSFHVPTESNTNLLDGSQYYRYLLKSDGTAERRVYAGGNWNTVNASYLSTDLLTWQVSPTVTVSRTVAEEFANFANWYSYHRTRNKVAKAGASEAFADLGDNIRVGFNTIWNRDTYPIPVDGNDQGRFTGNNRDTWYTKLQNAIGSGYTPLRTSLSRTGKYFQDTSNTGPYGPLIVTEDAPGGKQLTCRQNFTIFTTDGYWNGINGAGGEGGDYTAPGDADSTAGSPITPYPIGADYTFPANQKPYADNVGNTLADVAMYFWKTDLRPDMINNVPFTNANPAFWQHMVTFGISIGIKGTLDKNDLTDLTSGNKAWTNPITGTDLPRIDDLFHAAVNSRGEFVAATNASEFAKALKDALAAISGRIGSSSNVAANSVSVGGDTRIFQAKYVTGQWTGELAAYPIVNNQVGTTATWSFTDPGNIANYATRKVFTHDGTGGATFPTTAQQTTLTANIANYIKGDQSLEISNSGTFRNRVNLVGDIVNSSPAYIKETLPDATKHETVFVSANDGMLHAIDAATGVERFAYVPGIINLTDLKTLVNQPYSHRFLVDGPVVVSTRKQTPGKNILVSSLGRGGKGLFALDVTDPANFDQTKVLWEVGGADDDMGKVISRPIITKANNNMHVAIVSNGINSVNGQPVLFVYNLQTGAEVARLIPTGPASALDDNGLSAASGIDNNVDGKIDWVYAGDLKGNIWKFDLTDVVPGNWAVSYSGQPLFTAVDPADSSKPQPITGGVAIAFDSSFKPWIYFGTGSYITNADVQLPKTKDIQTWYGIRDDGSSPVVGRSELKERPIIFAGDFAGKYVRAVDFEVPGDMKDGNGVDLKGWYIDLTNPPHGVAQQVGERIVGTPVVRGERVLVSSITPSLDPCNEGRGFLNEVALFTGASGLEGASGYLDVNGTGYGDDQVTVNGKKVAISSVDLNIFMPTDAIVLAGATNDLIVVGGSQGGTGTAPYRNSRAVGRISWHEMINN